jgi:hypothetical protein
MPRDDIAAEGPPRAATRRSGESGWPALGVESVAWQPRTQYASAPGQRFIFGPYQAAVVPEIADVASVPLSSATLSLATQASTEIARFDTEFGDDVAPFAAILLRTESVASSRIENLTASAKAIALAEAVTPAGRTPG